MQEFMGLSTQKAWPLVNAQQASVMYSRSTGRGPRFHMPELARVVLSGVPGSAKGITTQTSRFNS